MNCSARREGFRSLNSGIAPGVNNRPCIKGTLVNTPIFNLSSFQLYILRCFDFSFFMCCFIICFFINHHTVVWIRIVKIIVPCLYFIFETSSPHNKVLVHSVGSTSVHYINISDNNMISILLIVIILLLVLQMKNENKNVYLSTLLRQSARYAIAAQQDETGIPIIHLKLVKGHK